MTDAERAAVEWLQRSAASKSPSMAREHAKVLLAALDRPCTCGREDLAAALRAVKGEQDELRLSPRENYTLSDDLPGSY